MSQQPNLFVNIRPKPVGMKSKDLVRSSWPGAVYVDDYPLLLTLRPLGVVKDAKTMSKDNISKAITNPDTMQGMLLILADIWGKSVVNYGYRRIDLFCRKPVGQNFMLAFKEFLDENLMEFSHQFVDPQSVDAINSKGSSWVDQPEVWGEKGSPIKSFDEIIIERTRDNNTEPTPTEEFSSFISGKFED